jgi:hypothetical protein
MANVQAAGQSGLPETGGRALAVNGDQRLLQALTTEHFTLQTARSATIMESNGRSALFLSTANAAGAGRLPVAASAALGMLVAVAAAAGFGWHQLRRWRAAEASVPSLYPSQPGPVPARDQLPAEPSQADG